MSAAVRMRGTHLVGGSRLRDWTNLVTSPPPFAPTYHRTFNLRSYSKPTNPDPKKNPTNVLKPPIDANIGRKRFADFDLAGRVFIVTGGARGLGLALAEALVEAGGKGEHPC